MKDLFRGELVRLTSEEPDAVAKSEVRWQRDSEFIRLADGDPIRLNSEKRIREQYVERRVDKGFDPEYFSFSVRTLTSAPVRSTSTASRSGPARRSTARFAARRRRTSVARRTRSFRTA